MSANGEWKSRDRTYDVNRAFFAFYRQLSRQDANLTSERTCLSRSEHMMENKTNANAEQNEQTRQTCQLSHGSAVSLTIFCHFSRSYGNWGSQSHGILGKIFLKWSKLSCWIKMGYLRLPHTSRFFVVELQMFCRAQIGLNCVGTSACRILADFLSRLTAFRLGAE